MPGNQCMKKQKSGWYTCTVWSASSLPLMVGPYYCDKQEVRCHVSLNLSHLRYSCQRCILAVTQHCPSPTEATNYSSIFGIYFKCAFKIYGIWLHASKQASTKLQTHFCELAQARPQLYSSTKNIQDRPGEK